MRRKLPGEGEAFFRDRDFRPHTRKSPHRFENDLAWPALHRSGTHAIGIGRSAARPVARVALDTLSRRGRSRELLLNNGR